MPWLQHKSVPYLACIFGSAAVILIRVILPNWLGDLLSALIYIFAIVGSSALGGWKTGLFTAGLSIATTIYFFIPPYRQLWISSPVDAVKMGSFLVLGAVLTFLCELLRLAKSRILERQRKLEQEIDERHRAELAERVKAEELRVTLASIAEAVITTDAAGRITYLNRLAETLTGWSLGTAYGQPLENVFRIIDEQSRAVIPNPATRVLKNGNSVGFANHTLLISRDGKEVSIDDSAAPIRDDGGRTIGAVLVFRDVTERKKRELEARSHKERLELAQNIGRIGTFEWDIQTNEVQWSAMLEQLYGLASGSFGGRFDHWKETVHPEDLQRVELEIQNAVTQGVEFRTEFRIIRPDQSIRWIAAQGHVSYDEQARPQRMVGVNLDITGPKLAEQRVRLLWEAAAVLLTTDQPDNMLKQVFAKISPHLKLDTYFNYMINESATGLKLASCIGIPDETAQTITQLAFGQAICGTVALQRSPITATFIQQSNDPKVQLVKSFGIRAYACNPLMAGDKLLGTLSFASRQRNEFDEDELEFLRTICRYVTAAYEQLRLISQLQETDRRKTEFLATLAHELRNPLAPIRNGLQVLRFAGNQGDVAEEARAMMDRQLAQMVHIIDDLLDVSRISRGKLELRTEILDLSTVINSALETCRPMIEQAGHKLTVTLSQNPISLNGDPVRLSQVVSNLLSNAAKYTNQGGEIGLTVQHDEDQATIIVKDNGVGIPAEMLPKIFEMFTQVDQTLEKSQGGLGIGLTIVKQLIGLHGGSVEARSDGAGKGSEFVLRIPILKEHNSEDGAVGDEETAPPSASRGRILVVDDNRDSAHTLATLLKIKGMEVRTAHDGLQGLKTAEAFLPEMILLDIGMPKLNGYDTCRRIREQQWGREMVIVAMTGWGQDEDRYRSEEAGFNHHLVKPIEFTRLDELITSLRTESA